METGTSSGYDKPPTIVDEDIIIDEQLHSICDSIKLKMNLKQTVDKLIEEIKYFSINWATLLW